MRHFLLTLGCFLTACLAQSDSAPTPGTIYEPGIVGSNCPISASSASPQVPMLIYPQADSDAPTIESEIISYFDNSGPALGLSNYTSQLSGLRFWFINMTDADACGVGGLSGVDFVEVDGEDPDYVDDAAIPAASPVIGKRQSIQPTATVLEVPVATQTKPVYELRVMSQPENGGKLSSFQNYVYNQNPGQGITIYVIDSGVNPFPFGDRYNADDTIYSPRAPPGPQDDSFEFGHSTCNADKAAGTTYGIAKAANIIMAKKTSFISDTGVIFDMVRQDIVNRGLQGKAVVTFSYGSLPSPNGVIPPQWLAASNDMKSIMNDLNVPVVNSAGNDAERSADIDLYPKIFQSDDFPIINVGASNIRGLTADFSQGGPLLTVSAPGVDIRCTNPTGEGNQRTSGTSFAAPQVAGLLAYFLAMDPVPFDTSDGELAAAAGVFLKNTASWIRGDANNNDPLIAWNLITTDQNPPTPAAASITASSSIAPQST